MSQLDHTNRPVPVDESPEAVIKVWEVAIKPAGAYDSYAVRGWQAMLDFVRNELERTLENLEGEDEEKVSITVQLTEMTREEYDDICENI